MIQQLVGEFGFKWEGSIEKRWLLYREGGGGKGVSSETGREQIREVVEGYISVG